MAYNLLTRVYDTVADLPRNARRYVDIHVLGYYTANDGGGGVFYYDDTSLEFPDNGVVFLPPGRLITEPGRWIRVVYDSVLNVLHYGMKADNVFDNLPVFKTMEDTIVRTTTNKGISRYDTVYFPSQGAAYYFDGPLRNRHVPVLRGSQSKPTLTFKDAGLFCYAPGNPGGGQYSAVVENLSLTPRNGGLYQAYVDGQVGLFVENKTIVKRVDIYGFAGDNFELHANVAGVLGPVYDKNDPNYPEAWKNVVYGSNANNWGMEDCNIANSGGYGAFIDGGDSNVGRIVNCNFVRTGAAGIFDASLFGIVVIGCQFSDCSVYGGRQDNTRATQTYTGDMVKVLDSTINASYYYRCLTNNTNNKPLLGKSNATWKLANGMDDFTIPDAWSMEGSYGPGATCTYNNQMWISRGYFNPGPNALPPSTDRAWEIYDKIGINPMYDYDTWNATTAYKKNYFFAAREQGPLGVPSELVPFDQHWTLIGENDNFGLSFKYTDTRFYMAGGGFTVHRPLAASVYLGCYSEAGLSHNSLKGCSVCIGGWNGDTKTVGCGGWVAGNAYVDGLSMNGIVMKEPSSKIAFPTGSIAQDGNGMVIQTAGNLNIGAVDVINYGRYNQRPMNGGDLDVTRPPSLIFTGIAANGTQPKLSTPDEFNTYVLSEIRKLKGLQ